MLHGSSRGLFNLLHTGLLALGILCWAGCLGKVISGADLAPAGSTTTFPALVLLEQHPCTAQRLAENLTAYEALPIDGVFLVPSAGGYVFSHDADQDAVYDSDRNWLRAQQSAKLKYSVLLFRASGDTGWDWFSDSDWSATETNVRNHARMACFGGLKALAFDPEAYSGRLGLWKYSEQPSAGTKDLAAMRAQVQSRGAQFMKAVQEECPGLPVMGLGLASFAGNLSRQSDDEIAANWPTHTYGLLPAFTEGMATESHGTELIDGVEYTYGYVLPSYFDGLSNTVSHDVLRLMDPADWEIYRPLVRIASAVYVDGIMNLWQKSNYFGWWLDTDAQRLQILENNVFQGYRVSRPFFWIYSENPNWITGERVPAGVIDAIRRAREKTRRGEALGFESDVQALWDLVESRKHVGHK